MSLTAGTRSLGHVIAGLHKQARPKACDLRSGRLIQVGQISTERPLSRPLPKGTWDTHMHVVDPGHFPLDAKAQYQPHPHTMYDARPFYSTLGIERMVFVQPSIYGNDNSCMLEALREVGAKNGRAVVQFDPATVVHETLQGWHQIGVRGVRVNLVSVGREVEEDELRQELLQYSELLRPLGWVLEIYIPLRLATILERIIPDLGVKVCIDHFGQPGLPKAYDQAKAVDPYSLPGFGSLIKLMKGDTWVKMSGQYRISNDPEMRDLDPLAREFLKEAPNRVTYATDWPHTRFDGIDSKPFIEKCYAWCGSDTGLVERLFKTNAEELWDVPPYDQKIGDFAPVIAN